MQGQWNSHFNKSVGTKKPLPHRNSTNQSTQKGWRRSLGTQAYLPGVKKYESVILGTVSESPPFNFRVVEGCPQHRPNMNLYLGFQLPHSIDCWQKGGGGYLLKVKKPVETSNMSRETFTQIPENLTNRYRQKNDPTPMIFTLKKND